MPEEEASEQRHAGVVEEVAGTAIEDGARRTGILTHAALEQIDFARSSDTAVNDLVSRAAGSIGENDQSLQRSAIRKIEALLASPLASELAQATQIHREIGFRRRWVSGDGRAEVIGTIDCWYEDTQGWHIIDFKAVDAAFDVDAMRQYRLQVLIYAWALQPLMGRPPTSLRVVRLGPPVEIHSIPVVGPALEEAACRIAAAMESLRSCPQT